MTEVGVLYDCWLLLRVNELIVNDLVKGIALVIVCLVTCPYDDLYQLPNHCNQYSIFKNIENWSIFILYLMRMICTNYLIFKKN